MMGREIVIQQRFNYFCQGRIKAFPHYCNYFIFLMVQLITGLCFWLYAATNLHGIAE